MKKKKESSINTNNNNGITITDSISLSFNSKYRINSKLLLILTALAGVTGFTLSLLTLFDFPCDRMTIYSAEAVIFIVSSVIFMFPSRAKILLVPVYMILIYGIYRSTFEFSNGYAQFINIIAEKLQITQNGSAYYIIHEDANPEKCLTMFLMYLFMVLTTVICYNTIVKPRFITVFSCTFPFIEAGLLFGFSPDHKAFALLISYWIAVFAMRTVGNQYHSTSGKPVFIRKKNIFVSSGNLRNNVIEDIGIITLISVFSVFLISSAVLELFDIKRPEKIRETRNTIKTAISEMSIEKISDRINSDTNKRPVTDRSQLGNISKISFNNKTDLVVYLSDSIHGNLYLKGFVGAVYSENSWYALPDSTVKKNEAVFSQLESTGSFPQYYNNTCDAVLHDIYPDKITGGRMIVNSMFSENKYAFTPYSISPDTSLQPEKDAFFLTGNSGSYSYDTFFTPDYYKNMDLIYDNIEEIRNLTPSESTYRNFAYENYLLLPESSYMDTLAIKYSFIPDYNGKNIAEIYKIIKQILNESATYTLEPGKTPSDIELTYYLLTENHKGYCSHFATAAVVLARLSGVPARYAEGYVVIPSDIKKAEKVNSYYKIDVSDSRAHAWAEFYIDGYGWLPFEFTPGYDRGIISAENSIHPESIQTTIVEVPAEEVTSIVTVPAVTEVQQKPDSAVTAPAENADDSASVTDKTGTHPDDSNGNEKKPSKAAKAVLFLLKLTASVLLAALFVITLIITRHIITLRKRILSFRCQSNSKSVSNVYNYVITLLAHCGIHKSNMLPLEFAEYAEGKAKGLCEQGEITELINTALKAGFSKEEITKEELKQAVRTAYTISDNITKRKNKRDRIIFKYILNLGR